MFTEALWIEWVEKEKKLYKEAKNGKRTFLKKGYTHFDERVWFPTCVEEIRTIIESGLQFYNESTRRKESWQFMPFIKLLIRTPRFKYLEDIDDYALEDKIRPICFAAHKDSLIFGYYAFALGKKYEQYINAKGISECVLAYRSDLGLSNIQFAKQAFSEVQKRVCCSAITLDIKGYFDHLDHDVLKSKWKEVIGGTLPSDQYKIFKALTKYSYVAGKSLMKKYSGSKSRNSKMPSSYLKIIPGATTRDRFGELRTRNLIVTNDRDSKTGIGKGIPQGSALSAVLSNIYLLDFDQELHSKSVAEGFFYRRYCDDILIICDTRNVNTILEYTVGRLESDDYRLSIQPKKLEVIDFGFNSNGVIRGFKREKGSSIPTVTNAGNEKRFYKALQYLGFEFNGKAITIRSSSLSRYFRKMKARLDKTVLMAYGRSEKAENVFLSQILERYTHFGTRNFISYARNAASVSYKNSKGEVREGLDSGAIRKQLSRHMNILAHALIKKNRQRFDHKISKGKPVKFKTVGLPVVSKNSSELK